jgi:membrane protein involved in colicin uptake
LALALAAEEAAAAAAVAEQAGSEAASSADVNAVLAGIDDIVASISGGAPNS